MNAHEIPSALSTSSQEFKPLFPLGQIVATPAVIAHFNEHRQSILPLLRRHVSGDWGDICTEDRQSNAEALQYGYRLMSVYVISKAERLWIITEADRSCTTLLLPEEY